MMMLVFLGIMIFFLAFGALMLFGIKEPREEITSREVYGFHRRAVK